MVKNFKINFFRFHSELGLSTAITSWAEKENIQEDENVIQNDNPVGADDVANVQLRNLTDSVDVSLLRVPKHPPGVKIQPFHMTSSTLIPNIRDKFYKTHFALTD